MTKQEFIEKIAEYVRPTYEKYKILPSLAVAQAALESGFGKHAPGNNIFGYKYSSSWKGDWQLLWTKEWDGQKYIKVQAKFRKYVSLEDSIEDYLLLLQKPRYVKVRLAQTYVQAARQVKAAGYATSPVYADSLIRLIKEYNLERYDVGLVEIFVAEHFRFIELDSGDGAIQTEEIRSNLRKLATKLEELRGYIKKPIIVKSGYRSPEWNREVGGARRSMHLLGLASDIRISGLSVEAIAGSAKMVDAFNGIGIYYPPKNFVHLDLRDKPAKWVIK